MKQRYGYVRVSSKDQNIDRQMAAMTTAGISKERIYIDKLSGKDFNRPHYQTLVKKLQAGDCFLYNKSTQNCRPKTDIVACPNWT